MQRFNAGRAGIRVRRGEDLTLSHRQCRRVTKRVRKSGVNMTSDYAYYYVA